MNSDSLKIRKNFEFKGGRTITKERERERERERQIQVGICYDGWVFATVANTH